MICFEKLAIFFVFVFFNGFRLLINVKGFQVETNQKLVSFLCIQILIMTSLHEELSQTVNLTDGEENLDSKLLLNLNG